MDSFSKVTCPDFTVAMFPELRGEARRLWSCEAAQLHRYLSQRYASWLSHAAQSTRSIRVGCQPAGLIAFFVLAPVTWMIWHWNRSCTNLAGSGVPGFRVSYIPCRHIVKWLLQSFLLLRFAGPIFFVKCNTFVISSRRMVWKRRHTWAIPLGSLWPPMGSCSWPILATTESGESLRKAKSPLSQAREYLGFLTTPFSVRNLMNHGPWW